MEEEREKDHYSRLEISDSESDGGKSRRGGVAGGADNWRASPSLHSALIAHEQ